ncbi:uroporphyrinogen-III synthase isoform X2 [Biomphalaria pfeifferi]|uniref:Uroporphyrinogen-III synthase n=1 Tax=Biomphalaria pfeifferi TaxID=112525 RepID=A0AAD8BPK2_BIOPF|nr:uroporphyrinogen-III synthase isoform X2 [Biomphalaria pfeifferi]
MASNTETTDCKSITKKKIFLFKSPKENEVDKYTESLESHGMSCIPLPVLSFCFVNQQLLKSYLSAIQLFSAIIFTSVRAVESVTNVMKELDNVDMLTQIKTYVVGKTTAEAARKCNFNPVGENSGNAEALTQLILEEVKPGEQKPLLYPCSNIHRDTLTEAFTTHGIAFTEVISYETCPNKDLKNSLLTALHDMGLPDYTVFFSPSGFQYVHTLLDSNEFPLNDTKIIALGPATYKAICDLEFTPFGMAEKPDPESLLKLLL